MESLKFDLQEKTELLKEAGLALEQLETQISQLNCDREEEVTRLEAKLRQMEDDDEGMNKRHLKVRKYVDYVYYVLSWIDGHNLEGPNSVSSSSNPGEDPDLGEILAENYPKIELRSPQQGKLGC